MTAGGSPSGRIQRRLRRTVGISVALGVCGIAVFLFLKFAAEGAVEQTHLERGFVELDLALAGHAEHWAPAQEHFHRAAGRSMFDPYPIYCVATTGRLAALKVDPGSADEPPQSLDDVDQLLRAGHRPEARAALLDLAARLDGDARLQATLFVRLLTDLELAERRRLAGVAPP